MRARLSETNDGVRDVHLETDAMRKCGRKCRILAATLLGLTAAGLTVLISCSNEARVAVGAGVADSRGAYWARLAGPSPQDDTQHSSLLALRELAKEHSPPIDQAEQRCMPVVQRWKERGGTSQPAPASKEDAVATAPGPNSPTPTRPFVKDRPVPLDKL